MARTIAIISCLLAALFLILVSGDCCSISETEAEPEAVEVCAMVSAGISEAQPVSYDSKPKSKATILPPVRTAVGFAARFDVIPSRIIHCVFRE